MVMLNDAAAAAAAAAIMLMSVTVYDDGQADFVVLDYHKMTMMLV